MFAQIEPNCESQPISVAKDKQSVFVEDRTLWDGLRKGNELAFSMLYKRYLNPLFNYGMHFCHNKNLVMDTLHDLFGKLWLKRNNLSEVEAVRPYFYKSFRRLLIHQVNKHKAGLKLFSSAKSFEFALSQEESIIDEEVSIIQRELIRLSIQKLSKRQKEALFLRFYNDLSYSQVAHVMDLSVESIYNLISKSIQTLRADLKQRKNFF